MKEIKFNSELIPFILDGTKTQTRRPIEEKVPTGIYDGCIYFTSAGPLFNIDRYISDNCPYGKIGDSFNIIEVLEDKSLVYICDGIIKNITIDRIQKISQDDCVKEGIIVDGKIIKSYDVETIKQTTIDTFSYGMWDSIYRKTPYKWDNNPFVWIIEFERK